MPTTTTTTTTEDSVTWVNNGDRAETVNQILDDGSYFGVDAYLEPGQQYTFTFLPPDYRTGDVITFISQADPENMKGTITIAGQA